ncbi:MAG: hypothetical protein RL358_1637 [Pseudomonadota bacterium]|jgi:uncharacterized membrane protein YfcA
MSMVFCRGCGKEIHESALGCPQCGALQKSATQNAGWGSSMAWVVACAPLIGTFVEGFVSGLFHYGGGLLFIVSIAVNIYLCDRDEKALAKTGVDTSQLGNTWLVPIYLFNRAKLLNEKLGYPILWCVLFALQLGNSW